MLAVRLFLPATPFKPWNFNDWGNCGHFVLEDLLHDKVPVRVISHYPTDLRDPYWVRYGNCFTQMLPEHWVNVVVGPEFGRLHTPTRFNVAVVGGRFSDSIEGYDLVIDLHDPPRPYRSIWTRIKEALP